MEGITRPLCYTACKNRLSPIRTAEARKAKVSCFSIKVCLYLLRLDRLEDDLGVSGG